MSAVGEGLIQTGGILPGFQDALRVAPGGFDPNFFRRGVPNTPGILKGGTAGSDTLMTFSTGDDYLVGYGGGVVGETDFMYGYKGADTFAMGDSTLGVYYAPVGGSGMVEDYNINEGDVIQLAATGMGNYSVQFGDFRGDGRLDTAILYGNQPFAYVMNATDLVFTLA
jgi:hypothetical protein